MFDNVFPGHPVFDEQGTGIIFQGYYLPIDRLGLIFWLNRPTKLYYITPYEDPNPAIEEPAKDQAEEKSVFKIDFKVMTPDYYFAGFPRFSSDWKYLAFFASKEEFHTHVTYLSLHKVDNFGTSDESKDEEIIQRQFDLNDEFNGFGNFGDDYHYSKWIQNTHLFLVPTSCKGKQIVWAVDFDTNQYKVLKCPNEETNDFIDLFCVDNKVAFFVSSSNK